MVAKQPEDLLLAPRSSERHQRLERELGKLYELTRI